MVSDFNLNFCHGFKISGQLDLSEIHIWLTAVRKTVFFHAQKALFKVPKICNIIFCIENDPPPFCFFSKNSSDLVAGPFPKFGHDFEARFGFDLNAVTLLKALSPWVRCPFGDVSCKSYLSATI